MKTFDNEWIRESFDDHSTFFTRSMFGGLAAFLFGRLMLVLAEPTKTGRWTWHGVLICTDREKHDSIRADLPSLVPHELLRKWLFIDSRHQDFERTMEKVAGRIVRNDLRFGIVPRTAKSGARKKAR